MPAPLPSENTQWPSWFYPPETDPADPAAHGKIFQQAADVPEGWLMDYRQHVEPEQGVEAPETTHAAVPPEPRLSRAERKEMERQAELQRVRGELDRREIEYQEADSAADLQTLLDMVLSEEAEDARV